MALTLAQVHEAADKARAAAKAIRCASCNVAGVTEDVGAVIAVTPAGNHWLHGRYWQEAVYGRGSHEHRRD